MPPGRPCPICGRMFGTASIEIHIPQCQSKTIQQWRNDPATRDRPLPAGLAQSLSGGFGGGHGGSSSSRFGGASSSTTKIPGPSSLSSKLGGGGNEHQKVGGGGRGNANSMMMAGGGGGGPSQPLNLVSCRYCGRNFSADRIGKHESVCIGSQKARQTFDTKTQRLKELMDDMNPRFAPRRKGAAAVKSKSSSASSPSSYTSSSGTYNPNKKDWRSEHREFQQMIREAKADSRRSAGGGGGYGGGGYGGGGVSSSTRYNSRTTTSTSRPAGGMSTRGLTTNSRTPHGAGFSTRQPVSRNRAPSSGMNASRLSGIRDLSSGPSSSPGAPKQISILPTNDTSAGMWSAMGREAPSYGSYGPIGNRGGGAARARAQQAQNQSTGFW